MKKPTVIGFIPKKSTVKKDKLKSDENENLKSDETEKNKE